MSEFCVLDSATGRGIHFSPRIGTSSLGRLLSRKSWSCKRPARFASNSPFLCVPPGHRSGLASTCGNRSVSDGLRTRNTFIRPGSVQRSALSATGPEEACLPVAASSQWISRFSDRMDCISAGFNPESTRHPIINPVLLFDDLGREPVYPSRTVSRCSTAFADTAGCTNRLTITPHSHRSRHFWPRAAEKRPTGRELHCIVAAKTWLQEGSICC